MSEATQIDDACIRVALDNGETVELDGGTLRVAGEESPTVLLRMVPWRARLLAHVLDEWSAVSRLFNRDARPSLSELALSRTLDAAADAVDDQTPGALVAKGLRQVSTSQRIAALAVLTAKERDMSALQRLAVVDAAAWWLSEERGGEELAHALLATACSASTVTEHAYLALITPPPTSEAAGEQSESTPV